MVLVKIYFQESASPNGWRELEEVITPPFLKSSLTNGTAPDPTLDKDDREAP
jgi:hypothetical protein